MSDVTQSNEVLSGRLACKSEAIDSTSASAQQGQIDQKCGPSRSFESIPSVDICSSIHVFRHNLLEMFFAVERIFTHLQLSDLVQERHDLATLGQQLCSAVLQSISLASRLHSEINVECKAECDDLCAAINVRLIETMLCR